jgi:hypothetical protein
MIRGLLGLRTVEGLNALREAMEIDLRNTRFQSGEF